MTSGAISARAVDDPVRFLEEAGPLLLVDEARHNLMLGVVGRIASDPRAYPAFRLWLAEDADGEIVGAASMTVPWPLVLARPLHRGAIGALVTAVLEGGHPVPAVVGGVPEVHDFAARWADATGGRPSTRRREGVFALERVAPLSAVSGHARTATDDDHGLLEPWMAAFVAEALPDEPAAGSDGREIVERRMLPAEAGFWLWEDGGHPVSVAGYGDPTPNGIRIGPVYTPPEHRGRGYATALVGALSAWLLANGRTFCFLYTDLSNPTSNAIYRRIGYRQVCESANIALGSAP